MSILPWANVQNPLDQLKWAADLQGLLRSVGSRTVSFPDEYKAYDPLPQVKKQPKVSGRKRTYPEKVITKPAKKKAVDPNLAKAARVLTKTKKETDPDTKKISSDSSGVWYPFGNKQKRSVVSFGKRSRYGKKKKGYKKKSYKKASSYRRKFK